MLCVLTCSRSCALGVLTYLACMCALPTYMSFMLAVLRYFTRLRACVLGVFVCLICFTFLEVKSQKFLYRKICIVKGCARYIFSSLFFKSKRVHF